MKTSQMKPMLRRRALMVLRVSLCLTTGLASSFAADLTWTGGGDQFSWTDPANWGGTAPVAADSLFFGGATGLSPYNNFTTTNVYNGITFNSDAGAFTISGTDVLLGGGVTNNSANPQTIALNLNNNGANRVADAEVGALIYDAALKSYQIVKEGTNSVTLTGAVDNSSLGATVNNGALILAKTANNVRSLGSTVTVNTNGTVTVVGPGTDQIHYNQRIILNGGVFQLQNTFEEVASLSGSNLDSIVENGLAGTTNRLDLGGGSGHRGIYSGTVRDGAGGVFSLRVYRNNNMEVLNGTNTYTGTTDVQNNQGAGVTRLIVNGVHTGGDAYTISSTKTSPNGAALGGSGVISAAVMNFNANSFLSPGGALSADLSDSATFSDTTAALTISNAVNLNASTATLDIQLNGPTPGAGYDQVIIAGSGTFSNSNANLKLTLGYTPAVGDQFTIVSVPGTNPTNNVGTFASLDGVATDLSQGATFVEPSSGLNMRVSYRAEGSTFDAGAGNGNDIMLEVVAPAGGQNLAWRGNGTDNNWDVTTTANWWNGSALTTFTNGDFVTFDDTGSNNIPVNLVGALTPATVLVNATNDYVFAGGGYFTGTVVLTKTNTGTLSLVTDNDNIGSTIINQGIVQVGTNATTGTLSGNVAINAGGTLAYNRSDDVAPAFLFSGTGGFLHNGSGTLILTNTLVFSGNTTNSGGMLQLGDGTSGNGSIGGDIHISGTNLLHYYYGGDANIANSKSGDGTVVYEAASGNRTFTLLGNVTNVNFSGSNSLTAGVRLHASDGNGGYSIGNGGAVDVPDTAQVWLDRSATPYNQAFTLAGSGWTGDATPLGAMRIFGCTVSGPITLMADTRIGGSINGGTIAGQITGPYRLEVLGNQNSFILSLGPTNGPNTYASTLITSGAIRALNTDGVSPGAMTIDLAGDLELNGNNVAVASLSSGVSGAGLVQNISATSNATLTVGTDNSSTTFDGVFADGGAASLGLTKVGSGTLTLTASSTSTGPVSVNGGTLALSGLASFGNASLIAIGGGAVLDLSGIGGTLTLNGGQTLGGSGTVNGSVVSTAGSIIAPGSVGTLTVANNITLGGGMVMALNRSLTPNSDRLVSTSGAITGGGTLTVTNLGPALVAGDTFHLFMVGVSGIAANLPATDPLNARSYTWQDNLAANGTITVLSSTPISAPVLTNTVSAGSITFTWSGPFKLQSQTNSLSAGLGANWSDYPGGGSSPVTVDISPTNPAVFFRLSL